MATFDRPALERLVTGLFDYAGLFPPATLPWDEMLQEAAALPETLQRPHLVGADLVVRPEHIGRLSPEALRKAGFRNGRTVRVCIVGVPLAGARDVLDAVPTLRDAFHRGPYPFEVAALEVADGDALDDVGAMAGRLGGLLDHAGARDLTLYYEPRWPAAAWRERAPRAFGLLDGVGDGPLGLKVRCAGPTALDAATLAALLPGVVRMRRPFKATQGLHHAVADPGADDAAVGFLGLVMALRLHEAGVLDAQGLAACIGETDARAFTFDGAAAWRDVALAARDDALPFAIGSCSLAEPDESLVAAYGRA